MVAFVILFGCYQAAEGLGTMLAPASPAGPALMCATLALAWPLGRWIGGGGYAAYGLAWHPGIPRLVAAGLLLAGLAKLASLALAAPLGAGALVASGARLSAVGIALAAIITFIPSIAEDILTRGFLFRAFPLRLGPVAFIVGSALLYTLNHVWRFDWGVSEQLRLFCLGLAYAAATWRWRTLWGAVALHWGWNLANTLADPLLSLEGGRVDAARYVSAGAHLALLAVVLLLPKRQSEKLP
ncbi:MAG TPA: CPBP family intramembrane glutamic endopeptidase [Croceibacterium sp.]|nr:CPBP family intramembrane glutamic endopeptidase [Croceibacterium sp.]